MQTEHLEARLSRIEDRHALEDLVKRYFLVSDDDDDAGLAALFAADGEFLISGALCATTPSGVAGFIAAERRKMGLTNHVLDNVLLALDGSDQATGLVRAHLELVHQGVAVLGAVRYTDAYVRQNGLWLLQRREMRVLYLAPWSQLGEALTSTTPVRWPGMEPQATDFPRRLS